MKVKASFCIEREGEELTLIVDGLYQEEQEGIVDAPPEDCVEPLPEQAEIDTIRLLDGKIWPGTLTEVETEEAKDALIAFGRCYT